MRQKECWSVLIVALLCAAIAVVGDDYGLAVQVQEERTGCSLGGRDGGISILNTNPGAWLRLEWHGISESKNIFFRNEASGVQYCGFASTDTFCINYPEECVCYGECNDTTCPEHNEDLCTSLGGGCEVYDDCCDDCGCEIPRSDLLDVLDRLIEPGEEFIDSCSFPGCTGEDCGRICDNSQYECFSGTPWCTQLVSGGGSGMHVEITDVSFDGTCFLTSEAPELPVSLNSGDIEIVNACSE